MGGHECYTIIFAGSNGAATYMHVWSTADGVPKIASLFMTLDRQNRPKLFNELGRVHNGDSHHFRPLASKIVSGFIKDREELRGLASEAFEYTKRWFSMAGEKFE